LRGIYLIQPFIDCPNITNYIGDIWIAGFVFVSTAGSVEKLNIIFPA